MKTVRGMFIGGMVLLASVCFFGGAGATDITNKLGNDDGAVFKVTDNSGNPILTIEADTTSPNIIAGYSGNSVTGGVGGVVIGGGGVSGDLNTVGGQFGIIAGGIGNTATGTGVSLGGGMYNTANGQTATVSGGSNNTASDDYATIGGGSYNTASDDYATIGGGYNNEATVHSTVGGGYDNRASGDDATVAGGNLNTASGGNAALGGGTQNTASGSTATVGGGSSNTASGNFGFVGGGSGNVAEIGSFATVAGGSGNRVQNTYATVSGGYNNTASGEYATVAGGSSNTASGTCSFAAGESAKATHANSFVWSDGSGSGLSTTVNQVMFYYGNGSTCYIDSSQASWSCSSDRSLKENFVAIDNTAILKALFAMPVFEYTMKAGDPAIRHIGPVSQDFHAAFQLGGDDKTISSGDAVGVTMAAVQGLYALLQEKEVLIKTLQDEIEALKSLQSEMDDLKAQVSRFRQAALDHADRNAALEARLDRLEQTLAPRTAQISWR